MYYKILKDVKLFYTGLRLNFEQLNLKVVIKTLSQVHLLYIFPEIVGILVLFLFAVSVLVWKCVNFNLKSFFLYADQFNGFKLFSTTKEA
jgi:hypothetical protein